MKKITVNFNDNSYPVFIGNNILSKLKNEIDNNFLSSKILIVCDRNVYEIYEEILIKTFRKYGKKLNYYILPPGEKSKSYSELNKIYNCLIDIHFGRDGLIISIGGGVTGDLASFAASTFMRGANLIHIPTTLLSMVDSSIGGKTGLNFNKKKNIIGTFYQPNSVFIDTNFLHSLPRREYVSGLGEIMKYAFISNRKFYSFLNENYRSILKADIGLLERTILNSISIKTAVITKDEKDTHLRRILNFGHTFAHAYEGLSNYKIRHGEAVTIGIISALILSAKLKILSRERFNEFIQLPLKSKLKNKIRDLNLEEVVLFMKSDKKNKGGKINFVLLSKIGKILIDVQAGKSDIIYSIKKTQDLLSA